tara:strand:+ start:941 stop:1309 length:369 start_codon:yes stop_codon:yes gene_type:complete
MTQKQILETVLKELVTIKKHMPNGELQALTDDMKDIKEDMSDLKYTLLNPEDGVIVKTNQNSAFRRKLEANDPNFQDKVRKIDDLSQWRDGVNKALWIIFGLLAAIILRLIFEKTGVELNIK